MTGHQESVVILWRTERGQTLWQLRDFEPSVFYGGHWGLFGGGMNPGESPIQSALRELKEETGLTPKMLWDLGDFTHPELPLVHVFLVDEELDPEQIQLGEGADFGLFSEEQVLAGNLPSKKLGKSYLVVGALLALFKQVKANQFLRFQTKLVLEQDP